MPPSFTPPQTLPHDKDHSKGAIPEGVLASSILARPCPATPPPGSPWAIWLVMRRDGPPTLLFARTDRPGWYSSQDQGGRREAGGRDLLEIASPPSSLTLVEALSEETAFSRVTTCSSLAQYAKQQMHKAARRTADLLTLPKSWSGGWSWFRYAKSNRYVSALACAIDLELPGGGPVEQ
jgi:hypothetical protein